MTTETDGVYTQASIMVDLIDDEWAMDVLSDDDIDIPLQQDAHFGGLNDEDEDDLIGPNMGLVPPGPEGAGGGAGKQDPDERWEQIAVQHFLEDARRL